MLNTETFELVQSADILVDEDLIDDDEVVSFGLMSVNHNEISADILVDEDLIDDDEVVSFGLMSVNHNEIAL